MPMTPELAEQFRLAMIEVEQTRAHLINLPHDAAVHGQAFLDALNRAESVAQEIES